MDNQNNPQNNQPTPEMPESVKTFLESLLVESGFTPIDDAMKQEMINQLYVKLDNFLSTAIIENMPPQYIDEFLKLNEEGKSKEEIENFIRERMPNAQEVFARTMVNFRDIYLGDAGVIANTATTPPVN